MRLAGTTSLGTKDLKMPKQPSPLPPTLDSQPAPPSTSPSTPELTRPRPYSPISPPWLPLSSPRDTRSEPTDQEPSSELASPLVRWIMTGSVERWVGPAAEDTMVP